MLDTPWTQAAKNSELVKSLLSHKDRMPESPAGHGFIYTMQIN